MKKFIACIAILGMVAISTNILAYCFDQQPVSSNVITCAVNGDTPDGGRFYVPWNQSIGITEHCVWSGNSGQSSYASASCDGDPNSVQTTADASNTSPYNWGNITSVYGSIDLYVETQTGGGAYVEAVW